MKRSITKSQKPRPHHYIPAILAAHVLAQVTDPAAKEALSLTFPTGLRLSEVRTLKKRDVLL